ncbi:Zinc finger MYM-type protein 1 [Merluccius polli]|uniref:Zinc finger MYM-type protein 1 n=1 Tax=Merluccius polli TaxID=89951 RepID=A0AA47N0T5_MERPO|nr:Zinc finger MYM-type protein 1 [Merluccius polli]
MHEMETSSAEAPPLAVSRDEIELRFQRQWYQEFPWLHFIPGVEGALCFYCRKAFEKKTSQLAKNTGWRVYSFPLVLKTGRRAVKGKEQEAVCVRYIDHDLIVHEEFVGMYEVYVTTGENLAKVIMDVLLRLNLSVTLLRGQAYDGAANMAGIYSGAQAIIKKHQPLVPYVHCGAHCVNLITQHACTASSVVRDSLQWAHELGVLFGQSMKIKSIFQDITKAESGPAQSIRPLCPTRWTVRTGAIRSLLNQYQPVLLALEEMASGKSDSASRANGLLERLQRGNVVLGLLLALEVTEELECLNKSYTDS